MVTVIPKAAMPSLIRLVHGNTKGLKLLVEEFRAFWAKETETLENPQGDNLSRSLFMFSPQTLFFRIRSDLV